MNLLTPEQRAEMLANGQRAADILSAEDGEAEHDHDPFPVVKLFTRWGGATWLLTELDPDDPDIAFGLCDLGLGFAEIGSVSLAELAELRGGPLKMAVERDLIFVGDKPLSQYQAEAWENEEGAQRDIAGVDGGAKATDYEKR